MNSAGEEKQNRTVSIFRTAAQNCFHFSCVLNVIYSEPHQNLIMFLYLPNNCLAVVASNAEATTQLADSVFMKGLLDGSQQSQLARISWQNLSAIQ